MTVLAAPVASCSLPAVPWATPMTVTDATAMTQRLLPPTICAVLSAPASHQQFPGWPSTARRQVLPGVSRDSCGPRAVIRDRGPQGTALERDCGSLRPVPRSPVAWCRRLGRQEISAYIRFQRTRYVATNAEGIGDEHYPTCQIGWLFKRIVRSLPANIFIRDKLESPRASLRRDNCRFTR